MYDADTKSLPPPSGVPRDRALSTQWSPDGGAHARFRISTRGRRAARSRRVKGTGRMGVLCSVMLLCLVGLLWPAVGRTVASVGDGGFSLRAAGNTLCQFLLEMGLPPARGSSVGGGGYGDIPPTDVTDAVTEESPAEQSTDVQDATAQGSAAASLPTQTEEGDPAISETERVSDTNTEAEAVEETDAETRREETQPSPPAAWADLPVVSVDRSEGERGTAYIQRDEGVAHLSPSDTWVWPGGRPPVVLLVHAHPFEAYAPAVGDGTRGTVADLGARLAVLLREQGAEVIHVHPAMTGITADTSYGEAGERTRAAIEYYLSLYPEIGLVIDLRRSAELWWDGNGEPGILRTEGRLDGVPCAQLRAVVDGAHASADGAAAGRAVAAAQALRAGLYAREDSLTRPTWIRDGEGLIPLRESVVSLTLEVGAAGNTYAEAARLLPLLAAEMADWLGVTQKT